MSVKIDTAVFDRLAEIMNHFSKSVNDVQRHIDAYLDSVKQEFNRQLEIIDSLLKKAIDDEKKAKEAAVLAEKEWELATKAVENAEFEKNAALNEMQEAKSRKETAKNDLDDAYKAKQEAYQEKQEAYHDMKSHNITYEEFQEYLDDFNEKKDIYDQKKTEYAIEKANYQDKLETFKTKETVLRSTKKRQEVAKKAYYKAKDLHKKALEDYRRRESNLKEARKIHTTFRKYYSDYYRKYFPGESKSCDTLLTMLRSSMKREFDENMEKIKNATYGILRCSLKENVSVEAIYIQDSPRFQKSKDTRKRMKENFQDTMKELNKDMKRPEDEHPDYTERCKYCHLPIFLCECDSPNDPERKY